VLVKKICLFLLIILCVSCNTHTDVDPKNGTGSTETKPTPDFSVAVKFINDYTAFCHSGFSFLDNMNWILKNELLTDSFKKSYKNLVDSVNMADHEMGLDFDPVFDAQDFPDKGCELLSCDQNTGYITVKGKIDWPEFNLVLKVVSQNDKWLVDGCGVINIPENKRAKR
jgi:hypothetical protein